MNKSRFIALLMAFTFVFSQSAFLVKALPEEDNTEKTQQTATSDEQTENTKEEKQKFPEPEAKASILIDVKGNCILYQKNQDEKLYPASLTKIMTALIALEKGELTDTLVVTKSALKDITYLHSRLDLKEGETITLENALKALLVCSANDAANVIAEYIAGDIPTFVQLMNTRANELGMKSTHFVNPHGFHDDNHYSTAYDISVMAREAMKNPTFAEFVKIKTVELPATNISKPKLISQTNHLVSRYRNTFHYYPYATGLKTGSTEEAGSCLAATAEKNGISLLSVVLGCDNTDTKENAHSFVDTTKMFEYVFNNYKNVSIASTSDIIKDSKVYEAKDNTRVALSPSKNISVLLPNDYNKDEITFEATLQEKIAAPIEKGSALGTATYKYQGETIATAELIAANEVKKDYMLALLHFIAGIFLSPFLLIPLLIIVTLLVYNYYKQTMRRKLRRRKLKSQQLSYRNTNTYSNNTRRNNNLASRNRNLQSRNGQTRRSTTNRTSTSSRRTTGPTVKREVDPWDKYR